MASIISAVLAGCVLLDSGDGVVCGELQVLSVIAAVGLLGAVLLLQPHNTVMDGRLAACNAAATGLSAFLGSISVDTTLLTAIQAFLNGGSVVVIVAAFVFDGSLNEAWQRLLEVLKRPCSGNSAMLICPTSLQHQAAIDYGGNVPTALDRSRALEVIVRLICDRPIS